MIINSKDLVEYIFSRLVKDGMVMMREDIELILDLELEYLIEHGFAEMIEDDNETT